MSQFSKYDKQFHPSIFVCFRDYDSTEHSAAEVKREIETHLVQKEVLENIIPSSIMIGPFYISTDSVRQNLSKKRKALANALLELLSKKLRTQAEDVSFLLKI